MVPIGITAHDIKILSLKASAVIAPGMLVILHHTGEVLAVRAMGGRIGGTTRTDRAGKCLPELGMINGEVTADVAFAVTMRAAVELEATGARRDIGVGIETTDASDELVLVVGTQHPGVEAIGVGQGGGADVFLGRVDAELLISEASHPVGQEVIELLRCHDSFAS